MNPVSIEKRLGKKILGSSNSKKHNNRILRSLITSKYQPRIPYFIREYILLYHEYTNIVIVTSQAIEKKDSEVTVVNIVEYTDYKKK